MARFWPDDGYEQYKTAQVRRSNGSRLQVWVREDEIKQMADIVKATLEDAPSLGICHGARTGAEGRMFAEALGNGTRIICTEINEALCDNENVICWDFHDTNPEWCGKAAFVYSNALDHSYDPDKALASWCKTLRPKGLCFVHWSHRHGPNVTLTRSDRFLATCEEYEKIIARYMTIQQIIDGPKGRKIFVAS